ncbi:MAG: amidohydrolase 2, partial [Pseudonocardia sp.]|nr:amidohydrolase 2 [Pseudonocardia sp.]
DVPDDECSLIVEENARRMLNFPRVLAGDRRLASV